MPSPRSQPLTLREAKSAWNEARRLLALERIALANRESEYQYALANYLELVAATKNRQPENTVAAVTEALVD